MSIRAIEFYSGIGGLHRGLTFSSIDATVVRAFDWDQTACRVYEANYGRGIVEKSDISTLNARDIHPLEAQLWFMSPSCQPYTILNPAAKGAEDPRAKSFLHIMQNVLPELVRVGGGPQWMLIENVAGFESSTTRDLVLKVLEDNSYNVVELLLTPLQYEIPNSRLRYYLLAKARPRVFLRISNQLKGQVWRHIPGDTGLDSDAGCASQVTEVRHYLDRDYHSTPLEDLRIPDRVLKKWGRLFDIVVPRSRRTCCFTRAYTGYTQLVERAGSILQTNERLDTTEVFDKFLAQQKEEESTCSLETGSSAVSVLHPLGLRYFSPAELLRIFHFQPIHNQEAALTTGIPEFVWSPGVSTKSKYRLLGNSVNAEVVRRLINYLFEGDFR